MKQASFNRLDLKGNRLLQSKIPNRSRRSRSFRFRRVGADGLAFLAEQVEGAVRVALDLETTGLQAVTDEPRLLQLGLPDGEVAVVDLFEVGGLGPVADALRSAEVVGHNIGFDLGFLRHHFSVQPRRALDTMLASRVLDCGRRRPRGFHGLAEVTARTLRVRLPKGEQRSDWSGPLSEAQIKYAARDVAVLLPLYERLRADIDRLGLGPTLELEHDVLPAIVAMGLAGVRVDREGWEKAIRQREAEARHAGAVASELLEGVNLRSPQQLLPVLRARLGVDLDSTSKQALAAFRGDEAVDMLLEFRRRENFPRGLGAQVLEALDHSPDGRVRGSFGQLSAPTGRMSCRQPNLLAIPRDDDVRSCIVPAPGFMYIQADYSQIELRIAAELHAERHLLDVFADPDGDPHRFMAARMLNKAPADVTKEERQGAKAANFGLLYGMSAPGLVDYAATTYGTTITLRQARRYRRAFFRLYRRFHRWHEKTWRDVQRARGDLQANTVGGRIRQLERPKQPRGSLAWQRSLRAIWREALNTPIQGTGADGLKRAIVQLHPQIEDLGGRLVLPIHDELIAEVPIDRAEEAVALMREGMAAGMQHYLRRVQVAVDPVLARSWAEK